MEKLYDVVAIGELLIDFIESTDIKGKNPLYEANCGGAPANVLSMLQNLNAKTAFIGKVGDDAFGRKLKSVIEMHGVDVQNLICDPRFNTTLAFVSYKKDGDRDFSFYRNCGADTMLRKDEINADILKSTKALHFGTLSLTDTPARQATYYAVDEAKNSGAIISFDPNIRPSLWKSMDEAKKQTKYGLSVCDVLKISDNEIEWFTENKDYKNAALYLQEKYDIPLVLVTLGKDGAFACTKGKIVECKAFLQEKTVDTTGAGDTFCGCMLSRVLEYGIGMKSEDLFDSLVFANAAASIITTRKGALNAMPTKEEIETFIKHRVNVDEVRI